MMFNLRRRTNDAQAGGNGERDVKDTTGQDARSAADSAKEALARMEREDKAREEQKRLALREEQKRLALRAERERKNKERERAHSWGSCVC